MHMLVLEPVKQNQEQLLVTRSRHHPRRATISFQRVFYRLSFVVYAIFFAQVRTLQCVILSRSTEFLESLRLIVLGNWRVALKCRVRIPPSKCRVKRLWVLRMPHSEREFEPCITRIFLILLFYFNPALKKGNTVEPNSKCVNHLMHRYWSVKVRGWVKCQLWLCTQ